MVMLETVKRIAQGEVLYNNTTGTNGTVTLSETAANFDYLEVFYRTNDSYYNSLKVFSPNGKTITMIGQRYTSSTFFIKHKDAEISGTSITVVDNCQIYWTNGSAATIGTDNFIYIVRVVGYRSS